MTSQWVRENCTDLYIAESLIKQLACMFWAHQRPGASIVCKKDMYYSLDW